MQLCPLAWFHDSLNVSCLCCCVHFHLAIGKNDRKDSSSKWTIMCRVRGWSRGGQTTGCELFVAYVAYARCSLQNVLARLRQSVLSQAFWNTDYLLTYKYRQKFKCLRMKCSTRLSITFFVYQVIQLYEYFKISVWKYVINSVFLSNAAH